MGSYEKNTLQQDLAFPKQNFTNNLGNLDKLKSKYTDENNSFVSSLRKNKLLKDGSCLKGIKQHGFLLDSIENIANKYGKAHEYQMMYRNFSRNVHANDFVEYFNKQDHTTMDDSIEARNSAAFDLVLRIFMEMMRHMDYMFSLQMAEQLSDLSREFEKL